MRYGPLSVKAVTTLNSSKKASVLSSVMQPLTSERRRKRREEIFDQIARTKVSSEEWQKSMTLPDSPAPKVNDKEIEKGLSESLDKIIAEIRQPTATSALASCRIIRRQQTKQRLDLAPTSVQIDDLPAEIFLDILGRLSIGDLAGKTNAVSKIWYDCSEEICRRFFQRTYASAESFNPGTITNYARLVHRLIKIQFSSINHVWKWAADNGFDILWKKYALPLLIEASESPAAHAATPASALSPSGPMWLESIIAAALRRKVVMLRITLKEFATYRPNSMALIPSTLLMILGILSRDFEVLQLLMEGRAFPALQQDLGDVMQDTAVALGLSAHHTHLAASLRMICKAADSYGSGTSLRLLSQPILHEAIFICEHHKPILELLLTRCVSKRAFIDELLYSLISESRRAMVKIVLKYQSRQLRHILRVKNVVEVKFVDNVLTCWPYGKKLDICAELLAFALEMDKSNDCALLRHVLWLEPLKKHPARVWAWYRSLWQDITRVQIHATIISFLAGQKGALQSVLNDLFEELIVANKPGVAPALQALFENKDASVNLDPLGAVFRICSIPDRFYFIELLLVAAEADIQARNPSTLDTIPLAICRIARSKQQRCNWSYLLGWCARGVDPNAISRDNRSLLSYAALEQNAEMITFMIRQQNAHQPQLLHQLLSYFASQKVAAEKSAALQAIGFVLRQQFCTVGLITATDKQNRNVIAALKALSSTPENSAHSAELSETIELLQSYQAINVPSRKSYSSGQQAIAPRSLPNVLSSNANSEHASRSASAPVALSRERVAPKKSTCTIL